MFAVMSPGPDFFLITRQSLRYGRNVTIWTAFGIGSGILFHSILAITGIVLLITSNEFYLSILKYICSGYLLYLGVSSVMRTSSFEFSSNGSKWSNTNGFAVGLITNITNIKALLFFITLFGVVLNTDNTESLILYGLYMALATFIWFSFIGYVFTSQVFKSRFIKFFGYFEKGLGLILVIIAIQIIITEYI
jgi:threonine/homoserine/homoserine lactone efflux protein